MGYAIHGLYLLYTWNTHDNITIGYDSLQYSETCLLRWAILSPACGLPRQLVWTDRYVGQCQLTYHFFLMLLVQYMIGFYFRYAWIYVQYWWNIHTVHMDYMRWNVHTIHMDYISYLHGLYVSLMLVNVTITLQNMLWTLYYNYLVKLKCVQAKCYLKLVSFWRVCHMWSLRQ